MTLSKFPTGSLCAVFVFLFAVTLILPEVAAGAAEKKLTLTQLRALRKKLAHRKRRIIFNNDGDDIAGLGGAEDEDPKEKKSAASTPEGLLQVRTTPLVGSQVDSIFYHSAWGLKLYHGDGPYGELYDAPDVDRTATVNRMKLLLNYGKDPLDVMIDFCRQHDLEIFFSNRMNDTHDWYFPGYLYHIKVRHPEYTIGHARQGKSREESLKNMLMTRTISTALNYELQEIRDLVVGAMQEVCQTYDVDGIELDYFRGYGLFPTSPATPEQIELLNDMMRNIRQMTEEEGLQRGRPILIAARCINDSDWSLTRGLDVQTWLEEDLIDILMPFQILRHKGRRPLKSFFELAHRYDVSVYPTMQEREWRSSWAICRGEAMSRFAEGADGIATFNRFDPTHRLWRELGDPALLRDLDKTYRCPYYLPATVTAKGCDPLVLSVGDDVTSAPPANKQRTLKLRIHIGGVTESHHLQVHLNGRPLEVESALPAPGPEPQKIWFEFAPAAALFAAAENQLTAKINHTDGSVEIENVELDVRLTD